VADPVLADVEDPCWSAIVALDSHGRVVDPGDCLLDNSGRLLVAQGVRGAGPGFRASPYADECIGRAGSSIYGIYGTATMTTEQERKSSQKRCSLGHA